MLTNNKRVVYALCSADKYLKKYNKKMDAPIFHSFSTRRSAVLSKHAAVATSDPTATQVGLQLLKDGGNAADAAVGIAATLNLVDPGSTGLGGDCFVLFYDAATKSVKGLNARCSNYSIITRD